MHYHDDMSPLEVTLLLREIKDIDRLYEDAAIHDVRAFGAWVREHGQPTEEEIEEAYQSETMRRAALNNGRP